MGMIMLMMMMMMKINDHGSQQNTKKNLKKMTALNLNYIK